MNAPPLKTRRPSGKPPWPLVLLAGAEKVGKSYAAAEFSGSDLVGRTFWIEVGEGAADLYGALPGARYEIVEHDGTHKGIGNAVWAATRQQQVDGRPNAIVLDSGTELWDMLSAEAQEKANRRRRSPDGEAVINMDLWNAAKKKWRAIVDLLRAHNGPVVVICRLEVVTVVDSAGNPTKEKTEKIRAEKNLPFDVDVIVSMPAYGEVYLSGLRSLQLKVTPGERLRVPDFTLDALMRNLGLDAAGATEPRAYTAPMGDHEALLSRLYDRIADADSPLQLHDIEAAVLDAVGCGELTDAEAADMRVVFDAKARDIAKAVDQEGAVL